MKTTSVRTKCKSAKAKTPRYKFDPLWRRAMSASGCDDSYTEQMVRDYIEHGKQPNFHYLDQQGFACAWIIIRADIDVDADATSVPASVAVSSAPVFRPSVRPQRRMPARLPGLSAKPPRPALRAKNPRPCVPPKQHATELPEETRRRGHHPPRRA